MSRIPSLFIVAFATAAVACGSSETSSQTSGSHLFGDDQCKLDPSQCQPPTQPPVAGGKCFDTELSSNVCLNASTWTSVARAACSAQGANLTATTFSSPCGGSTPGQPPPVSPGGQNGQPPSGTGGLDPNDHGTGQPPTPVDQGAYQGVKLTCCTATPQPPPEPCIRIPIATTNGSDAKSDAVRVCTDKQLSIRSVEGDANGTLVAVCCPVQPPTQPPPNACTTIDVGDKMTCLSKQALSDKANAACAQQGGVVSSFSVTVPCADSSTDPNGGGASLASVTCCARPVDQTPPPDNFGQKP